MLWGSSDEGIKIGGNIHENQTFTFHKLPGCRRLDCFAFIWEAGKEIRRHVAVQLEKSGSANDAGDAQRLVPPATSTLPMGEQLRRMQFPRGAEAGGCT